MEYRQQAPVFQAKSGYPLLANPPRVGLPGAPLSAGPAPTVVSSSGVRYEHVPSSANSSSIRVVAGNASSTSGQSLLSTSGVTTALAPKVISYASSGSVPGAQVSRAPAEVGGAAHQLSSTSGYTTRHLNAAASTVAATTEAVSSTSCRLQQVVYHQHASGPTAGAPSITRISATSVGTTSSTPSVTTTTRIPASYGLTPGSRVISTRVVSTRTSPTTTSRGAPASPLTADAIAAPSAKVATQQSAHHSSVPADHVNKNNTAQHSTTQQKKAENRSSSSSEGSAASARPTESRTSTTGTLSPQKRVSASTTVVKLAAVPLSSSSTSNTSGRVSSNEARSASSGSSSSVSGAGYKGRKSSSAVDTSESSANKSGAKTDARSSTLSSRAGDGQNASSSGRRSGSAVSSPLAHLVNQKLDATEAARHGLRAGDTVLFSEVVDDTRRSSSTYFRLDGKMFKTRDEMDAYMRDKKSGPAAKTVSQTTYRYDPSTTGGQKEDQLVFHSEKDFKQYMKENEVDQKAPPRVTMRLLDGDQEVDPETLNPVNPSHRAYLGRTSTALPASTATAEEIEKEIVTQMNEETGSWKTVVRDRETKEIELVVNRDTADFFLATVGGETSATATNASGADAVGGGKKKQGEQEKLYTLEQWEFVEQLTALQLQALVKDLGQRMLEVSGDYKEQQKVRDEEAEKEALEFFGLDGDSSTLYKKKAKEMHPDKNGGTDEAKQAFQDMRAMYDLVKSRFDHPGAEDRTASVSPGRTRIICAQLGEQSKGAPTDSRGRFCSNTMRNDRTRKRGVEQWRRTRWQCAACCRFSRLRECSRLFDCGACFMSIFSPRGRVVCFDALAQQARKSNTSSDAQRLRQKCRSLEIAAGQVQQIDKKRGGGGSNAMDGLE
ncbi:unnamed protein product [Amoebophrya sp. A25]|nr:unnamed protein product [Amoebophrya sp. A25]|eukprot:GSA25T00011413001.1